MFIYVLFLILRIQSNKGFDSLVAVVTVYFEQRRVDIDLSFPDVDDCRKRTFSTVLLL